MASLRHATVLCLIAGFVDAIGYFQLGHVFPANMTGNTVLLGAAIAGLEWPALFYLATLAAFTAGAAFEAALWLAVRSTAVPMLFNAAVLTAVATTTPSRVLSLATLAFLMGVQAGAAVRLSQLPTVVITSTIVRLAQGVIDLGLRRTDDASARAGPEAGTIKLHAIAWASYLAGAMAAALTSPHVPYLLVAPAVLYAALAVELAVAHWRAGWGSE